MIHLKQGAHDRREDGMCAMEAAAYIADKLPDSVIRECIADLPAEEI